MFDEQHFVQFSEQLTKVLWFAEIQSPCPDADAHFLQTFPPRTAFENMAVFILSLGYEKWETERVVRTIARNCYKNNYQGRWQTLQAMLERIDSVRDLYDYLVENNGFHEFFGNLLPLAARFKITAKMLPEVSPGVEKRYVKKKRFVGRGYDDKGSLRPLHKPVVRGERRDCIDRRNEVKHPMLKE